MEDCFDVGDDEKARFKQRTPKGFSFSM